MSIAREKGAVAQVRINTVVRKKFSEVYGSCSGAVQLISSVFNYIYVSYAQIMYSRWKTQTDGTFF